MLKRNTNKTLKLINKPQKNLLNLQVTIFNFKYIIINNTVFYNLYSAIREIKTLKKAYQCLLITDHRLEA